MDDETLDELVTDETAGEKAPEDSPAVTSDDKTVSLDALHEARQQNRELREELEGVKIQGARMEEIQRRLDDLAKPTEPDPEPIVVPIFEEDPKGYIDAQMKELRELQAQVGEQATQTAETTQQASSEQQLNSAISADHQEFIAKHADYMDALNFARDMKLAELTEAGVPEIDAKRAMRTEEIQLAAVALQNGKSPAEVAYNRAKRWGFTAEEKPADEEKPDLDEAASMGGSGGPSVQEMLDADSDEFDDMFAELGYGKKMV